MKTITISSLEIYPCYPGVATEFAPVVFNGTGALTSGQIMGQQFQQLTISEGEIGGTIQVGAAYSWIGWDKTGNRATSHWLYCTSVAPHPTFGAICDWSRGGTIYPLLDKIEEELIFLEDLTDLTAVLPASNPAYGAAQAQLGKGGRLVMTAATAPAFMGVLIDGPALPLTYSVGTSDITISATSSRTLQTISLANLYFARLDSAALFLKATV